MPNIAKQFYPEVQGLRAVSIIAVILFHFGINIEVVVVQSVPILPKVIQNLPVNFTQTAPQIRQQNKFMNDFVQGLQESNIVSLDLTPAFCDDEVCRTRIDGNILYTDNNHVSPAGAARIIKLIEPHL